MLLLRISPVSASCRGGYWEDNNDASDAAGAVMEMTRSWCRKTRRNSFDSRWTTRRPSSSSSSTTRRRMTNNRDDDHDDDGRRRRRRLLGTGPPVGRRRTDNDDDDSATTATVAIPPFTSDGTSTADDILEKNGNTDVYLPTDGISISDEMLEEQYRRNEDGIITDVVPIHDIRGVAQLVTSIPMIIPKKESSDDDMENTSKRRQHPFHQYYGEDGSDVNEEDIEVDDDDDDIPAMIEPVRYLVPLWSPPTPKEEDDDDDENENENDTTDSSSASSQSQSTVSMIPYVMVDIPPYSDSLFRRIHMFLSQYNGMLRMLLITNKKSMHSDDEDSSSSPFGNSFGTMSYTMRNKHLQKWIIAINHYNNNKNNNDSKHRNKNKDMKKKKTKTTNKNTEEEFNVEVVAYRLDVPRDCRHLITQVLDGYGPFALVKPKLQPKQKQQDQQRMDMNMNMNMMHNMTFMEAGRPLIYEKWDHMTTTKVMNGKMKPPDDTEGNDNDDDDDNDNDDSSLYTPEAIRQRENGSHILAIYTPGHTFGSVSYVFPTMKLCCSGYTIPIENTDDHHDDEDEEDDEYGSSTNSNSVIGSNWIPKFDYRGYIGTSYGGMKKQMSSARSLIETYIDRFHVVFPSVGDPLFLDYFNEIHHMNYNDSTNTNADTTTNDDSPAAIHERKKVLLNIVDQYERLGQIYDELGITTTSSSSSTTSNTKTP